MISRCLFWLLGAAALLTAAEAPRFSGPEVTRLDWNTRARVAADLDGDGRLDLAMLNNSRSQLELLYQRDPDAAEPEPPRRQARYWQPVLDDSRLRREHLPLGMNAWGLAVADFNGDGRVDLAITGDPDGLILRFQDEDGKWLKQRVFDDVEPVQWAGTLRAADLDGDGRQDLLAMTATHLLVYRQNDAGELVGPERYALPGENCYNLQVTDVDGDGRQDVCYQTTDERYALRLRRRREDGSFGPELALRSIYPRSGVRPIVPVPGERPALALVRDTTGVIATARLVEGEPATRLAELRPRFWTVDEPGGIPAPWIVADVDGDGRRDLLTTAATGASIHLLRNRPHGGFEEPVSFPAYAQVRSLSAADVDGDGREDVLAVSPFERAAGIARWEDPGRLSYPAALPLTGDPLAGALGDFLGKGTAQAAIAIAEPEMLPGLQILERDPGGWTVALDLELGGNEDLDAIRAVDANQDGLADLLLLYQYSSARLLLNDRGGGFVELAAQDGFRAGLLAGMRPGQLAEGDVDGDGKPELLLGGRGLVRAVRVDAEGILEVVAQYNSRQTQAAIASAWPLDVDGDGTHEMLLLDAQGGELELLKADDNGVYRHAEALDIGPVALAGSAVMDVDDNGRADLLLGGAGRLCWLPFGRPELRLEILATYETDLEDQHYTWLAVGDLVGGPGDELVAVDAVQTRILEVFDWQGEDGWRSLLHFPVFETDPHYQGPGKDGEEPREMLIADLTGDGRNDIVLLVHDRLLLYPRIP